MAGRSVWRRWFYFKRGAETLERVSWLNTNRSSACLPDCSLHWLQRSWIKAPFALCLWKVLSFLQGYLSLWTPSHPHTSTNKSSIFVCLFVFNLATQVSFQLRVFCQYCLDPALQIQSILNMNAKLLLSLKAVFMSLCKDLEESRPQEQVPMLYLTLPAFSPRPSVPGWPDSRNPLIPSSLSKKKKKNHQSLPSWIQKVFSQLQPLVTFLTLNL